MAPSSHVPDGCWPAMLRDLRPDRSSPSGKPRSWPKFLPGGKHLLYVNPDSSGSGCELMLPSVYWARDRTNAHRYPGYLHA